MPDNTVPPNELADFYDGFFTVLELLPDDAHPLWQLTIESVLFRGEALADGARPYGEQQAERNSFKMAAYREQYGDGERVTEFPVIGTAVPRQADRRVLDESRGVPVGPTSEQVIPLRVDEDSLTGALKILAEFPAEPAAETLGDGLNQLLDPHRLPGLSTGQQSTGDQSKLENKSAADPGPEPNELADLYDLSR